MTESGPSSGGGVLSGQGVVDFSHLTSAEELGAVSRIEGAGAVVVPESLAGAYAAIPTEGVGGVVYVPDGANVRVHVGPLMVGGDGLGAAEDVRVVVGVLLITSPVTGVVPRQVSVVGSVLAPQGSESAIGPLLGGGVGSVTYYRYAEGQHLKVLSGQVKLSGTILANPAGQPDDVLIAAGQVVVTGPVTSVGYAQVIVAGQLVAPAASRDVLEPRLQAQGQSAWYRSDDPRIIIEDTRLGPDFFRLLDHQVSLVVLADLSITPGVTEAVVLEKVADIILLGDLTAPGDLVPVLQVLAADAFGTIRAGAEAALGDEPAPAPPSAATAVIAAERVAIVGEAIKQLPEQQRTTLAMAAAGGLTSAEIAAALGVPAGTVRYRLSLARRALAAALARYDHPAAPEPR